MNKILKIDEIINLLLNVDDLAKFSILKVSLIFFLKKQIINRIMNPPIKLITEIIFKF